MSLWAGKQPQATLAAASTRASFKPSRIDIESVRVNVINELKRLITIVNTLKSTKPELTMASALLNRCVEQVNDALVPKSLVVQSEGLNESEMPSAEGPPTTTGPRR